MIADRTACDVYAYIRHSYRPLPEIAVVSKVSTDPGCPRRVNFGVGNLTGYGKCKGRSTIEARSVRQTYFSALWSKNFTFRYFLIIMGRLNSKALFAFAGEQSLQIFRPSGQSLWMWLRWWNCGSRTDILSSTRLKSRLGVGRLVGAAAAAAGCIGSRL